MKRVKVLYANIAAEPVVSSVYMNHANFVFEYKKLYSSFSNVLKEYLLDREFLRHSASVISAPAVSPSAHFVPASFLSAFT